MFFGCSHFEKIFFGSCRQSRTPKTQNVYNNSWSAWIHENMYREGTHVSAHMYICPYFRLIFYHDPCCYPVCSLVFSVIRGEDIFFYLLCIFVLTMSFLMLGSFSKTMQMLLASASLLNLANLLPIFASHLFFSRLIGFLSLCM